MLQECFDENIDNEFLLDHLHPGNPEEYFCLMEKLTAITKSFIYQQMLSPVGVDLPNGIRDSFNDFLADFQRSREGTRFLRPTTMFLSYMLFQKEDSPVDDDLTARLAPAMAIIELLNSSTYVFNSILDHKRGYTTTEKIQQGIIEGNIYREVCEKSAERLSAFYPSEIIEFIKTRINQINLSIYKGQYFDIFELTIDNFAKYKADEELYYKLLQERNEGFSGLFYSFIPELGAVLSQNATDAEKETIAKIGKIYGHALQLTNDLGDCLPPLDIKDGHREKPYKDTLSDLRNGRLTLPIFLAMKNSVITPELIDTLIKSHSNENMDDIYKTAEKISSLFVESGVFKTVRDMLKNDVNKMVDLLDTLPKNKYRDFMKGQFHTSLLRNKWLKQANKLL